MQSTTLPLIDNMTVTSCVRNTFIDWHLQPLSAKPLRRNKSLPPSFGSSYHGLLSSLVGCPDETGKKVRASTFKSDDSTDVRTEASSEDTPLVSTTFKSDDSTDVRTEASSEDAPSVEMFTTPTDIQSLCVPCYVPVYNSGLALPQASATPLSSKASSFQPSQALSKVNVDGHGQVVEMVDAAKAILEQNDYIQSVDMTQGLNGWTMSIVPHQSQEGQGRRFQDWMCLLAKNALVEASEQSKSVYVLGYYNAEELVSARQPQGFTVQLGVMEDTTSACWAMLKHGSCRYGEQCCKEHPALLVPVRVFIEAACFSASRHIIHYWKQEIATFMMMVTAILTRNPNVEEAAAFNNQNGDGWHIEMSIRAEDICRKESFLTLAKNAFMEAMQRSDYIRVMGSGASPFISKSDGFVVTLGEMADRSQACWDYYTQGCCYREAACRWQHPHCTMPVNVMLKTMPHPTEAAAMQEDDQVDLVLGLLTDGS